MLQDQVRIKKRIKSELKQKQMILRKRLIGMEEEVDTLNSLLSKAKTQVSTKEREMALSSERMRKLAKSNDQLQRTNEMLRLNCKELQEESQDKDSKVSQVFACLTLFDIKVDLPTSYPNECRIRLVSLLCYFSIDCL